MNFTKAKSFFYETMIEIYRDRKILMNNGENFRYKSDKKIRHINDPKNLIKKYHEIQ